MGRYLVHTAGGVESYLSRLPMASSMHLIPHTSRRDGTRSGNGITRFASTPTILRDDGRMDRTIDRSIGRSVDQPISKFVIAPGTFRFGEVIDFATASHYEFNYAD